MNNNSLTFYFCLYENYLCMHDKHNLIISTWRFFTLDLSLLFYITVITTVISGAKASIAL